MILESVLVGKVQYRSWPLIHRQQDEFQLDEAVFVYPRFTLSLCIGLDTMEDKESVYPSPCFAIICSAISVSWEQR